MDVSVVNVHLKYPLTEVHEFISMGVELTSEEGICPFESVFKLVKATTGDQFIIPHVCHVECNKILSWPHQTKLRNSNGDLCSRGVGVCGAGERLQALGCGGRGRGRWGVFRDGRGSSCMFGSVQ